MYNYLELRKEELKKRGNKGFTLMEMLIVVAIIAVLIAIAIPVFTSQLENSREATDAANLRGAYAEVTAAMLEGKTDYGATDPIKYDATNKTWTKTVNLQQQQADWQNTQLAEGKIGEVSLNATDQSKPAASGTCDVKVDSEGKLTLTFSQNS